jgi:DNA-binding NarL/FixJ family response regulator
MVNGERQTEELHRSRVPGTAAACLTPREWEAMGLLRLGLTDKEIAKRLEIETCTVNAFLKRIYPKLETHTRRQAVQKVFGAGRRA